MDRNKQASRAEAGGGSVGLESPCISLCLLTIAMHTFQDIIETSFFARIIQG